MVKKKGRMKYLVGFSVVFIILVVIISIRNLSRVDTEKYSNDKNSHYSKGPSAAPVVLKEFSDYR